MKVIYICNFHVLNHFLLIFICKLHWNSPYEGSLAFCEEDSEIVFKGIRVKNHDINFISKEKEERYAVRDSNVNRNPMTNDFMLNKKMNRSSYNYTLGLLSETFGHASEEELFDENLVAIFITLKITYVQFIMSRFSSSLSVDLHS